MIGNHAGGSCFGFFLHHEVEPLMRAGSATSGPIEAIDGTPVVDLKPVLHA
jgi:hypothetical protein